MKAHKAVRPAKKKKVRPTPCAQRACGMQMGCAQLMQGVRLGKRTG